MASENCLASFVLHCIAFYIDVWSHYGLPVISYYRLPLGNWSTNTLFKNSTFFLWTK